MSNEKPHYYITDQARKRFIIWLATEEISLAEFARRAGCSRQYLSRVLHGQVSITSTVREWFKKGGYEEVL